MGELALTRPRTPLTLIQRRPLLLVSRMFGLTAALRRQNRPLSPIQRPLGLVQRAAILPTAGPARSPLAWRPTRMIWSGRPLTVASEAPAVDEGAAWEWTPDLPSAYDTTGGEETALQRSEVAPSVSPPPSVPRVIAQRPAPPGYSIAAEAQPSASPQPAPEEEPSESEEPVSGLVRGSDLWRRMFPERPRLRDVIQARDAAKQKKAARRAAPPTIPDNLPRTRTWEISSAQPGQPAVSRAPASSPPARPDESVRDSAVTSEQRPVAEEEGPEEAPTQQKPLPPPAERRAAADSGVQKREPSLPSGPSPSPPAARSPRRKPPKSEKPLTEPSEGPQAAPSPVDSVTTGAAAPVQRATATLQRKPSRLVTAEDGPAADEATSGAPPEATSGAPPEATSGAAPAATSGAARSVEPPARPIQRDDSDAKEAPARSKTPLPSMAARQLSAPAEPADAEPSPPASKPTVTLPSPASEPEVPAATVRRALVSGPEPRPSAIQKQPASLADLPAGPSDRASVQPPSPLGQPARRVTAESPAPPKADRPGPQRPVQTAPAAQERAESGAPTVRLRPDVAAALELPLGPPPAPVQIPDESVERTVTEFPTISATPRPGVARQAAEPSADRGEADRPIAAEPGVDQARTERPESLGPPPSRPAKPSGRQRVQTRRQVGVTTDTLRREPARPEASAGPEVLEPQSPPAPDAAPSRPQAPKLDLASPKTIRRSVVQPPAGSATAQREPATEPVRVEPVPRPRPSVTTPDLPVKRPVVSVSVPRATTDDTAGVPPTDPAADASSGQLRVASVQRAVRQAGAEPVSGTVQPRSMPADDRVDPSVPAKSVTHPMPLLRVPANGPTVARHVGPSESGDRPEPSPWWSGVPAEPAPSLPLHIPARPAPAPVQRTEAAQGGTESQPTEGTSASAEGPAGAKGPDLEELARQVYPYLRRRLSVERERTGRG